MYGNQPTNQPLIRSKSFRHDINGLRAWAVVAVVLYHFGVPGFTGGFVGVDVFFVISGFLMTGIIIAGLERGKFSLWGFYLARARRIIPALLALCASLLILGWFWLPSVDYKMLAAHVGTAVAFVSNLKFWREAGYFDAASHEKWLLHTWSLSVEWQFYILLPLGCLLLWHFFGKRGVKWALVAVGMLSLALSIYVSVRWPGAAFYLLPTRAWEMLAGGLVWWATRTQIMPRQWAALTEGLGFALIIWAISTFDPAMQWPGYLALVPVVGAMLVLAANRQHSWFTANLFARHLGASSYSIYLWHWPLVVLLTYAGEQGNPLWIILGVSGSLMLGEVSYLFVENPTRRSLATFTKLKESLAVLSPVIMLVFLSCVIFILGGANLPIRSGAVSDSSKYIDKYSRDAYLTNTIKNEYKLECDYFNGEAYIAKNEEIPDTCAIKNQEDGIFLWGDSHAQALSYGLRKHLLPNYDFYQIASSGCQPHLGSDSVTTGQFKLACDRSNNAAIRAIEKLQPRLVIMAQQHDHDKNHYEEIVKRLTELGVKHIVIVGPVPQWQPSLPRTIGLRHFDKAETSFADSAFDRKLLEIDNSMKVNFSERTDVSYISILDKLCHRGKCLAKVDDNNSPLVWDYGHLSLTGSDFIVQHVFLKNDLLRSYLR
ncbi:acyltransferase family protein [Aeromonas veronii]|uniref:acyltransferase family protein n=1 Tax=Aeromonas veronii TaxID=654 RepID=UPI001396BB63|nr:acyltransferase family protein [Aeromonas veronii]